MELADSKNPTLKVALKSFGDFCNKYAKSTKMQYLRQTRNFVEYLSEDVCYIEEISTSHIESYIIFLQEKGNSEKSVESKFKVLRVFFRWSSLEYELPDPARSIPYPKKFSEVLLYLTKDNYSKVIANASVRERDIIIFLANTGLTATELVNLNWENIKEDCIITGGKRNLCQRNIPISSEVKGILKKNEKKSGKFPLGKMNRLKIWRRCKTAGERVGLSDVSPQTLRHFYAINLIREGLGLKLVSYLLGHSCIAVTERLYPKFIKEIFEEERSCYFKNIKKY